MSTEKIYLEPEQLLTEVQRLRADGLEFAFANGCFELLHVGHIRYLQAAREEADRLIVAVNTDASLKVNKPDRNPINKDHDRWEILAAFECIDYIVPLREETPISLIELLQPEVHCKGSDYTVDQLPERGTVEGYGGRVAIVGGPKVQSTRHMLREMREGQ